MIGLLSLVNADIFTGRFVTCKAILILFFRFSFLISFSFPRFPGFLDFPGLLGFLGIQGFPCFLGFPGFPGLQCFDLNCELNMFDKFRFNHTGSILLLANFKLNNYSSLVNIGQKVQFYLLKRH